MSELLPCPFCGGEAAVRDIKEPSANGWVGCQRCRCFMDFVKNGKPQAIAAWNRRAQPENKPLTLDELRQMDGEPVWIVEHPTWGHWELSEDAADYYQDRGVDFYGMTCSGNEDGWCSGTCKYGLHNMGWLAYRNKPTKGDKDE